MDDEARHRCPRRNEIGSFPSGVELPDSWRIRDPEGEHPGSTGSGQRSCSYCGSMHPDDFMDAVKDGWEIGPTDKNYKAYVTEKLGGQFNPQGSRHHKFYFQHLSEEQRTAFVDALNARQVRIGYPGRFYAMPFFISRG